MVKALGLRMKHQDAALLFLFFPEKLQHEDFE